MSRPSLLDGALVGLLLTAPLVVVSALANQLAGLPFAPFDLFPFVRDLTPGPVLTLTIDTMVGIIRALDLGRVDSAAKIAEQGMAVLMLVGAGAVVGALFFGILRGLPQGRALVAGAVVGLLAGLAMVALSASVGLSSRTGQPALDAAWLLLLFLAWGVLLGWAYTRLTSSHTSAASTTARMVME